jgi:predicted Ser/Thr protein kinase
MAHTAERLLGRAGRWRELPQTVTRVPDPPLAATPVPPRPAPIGAAEAATLPPPTPVPQPDTGDYTGVPAALLDHPRYRVVRLLGSGGMGAVYQAEHRLMERPVALKVVKQTLTDNPAMVERFRREVKAAARLAHPNIVTAHDAEQAGDTHFLVMEFVEGTSLAQLVARQGPLPVSQACDYIRQAARGLEHAHECGMVHRDIKPQNLMLTPRGQVKILDFGLARFASELQPAGALTASHALMGSPDYIAPEQAVDSRNADIRADVYALGCTLYHLLTGHPPFPEGSLIQKVMAHMEHAPASLTAFRSDLPDGLVQVVERMMAKRPEERYQTPGEVAAALEQWAVGSGQWAVSPKVPERPVEKRTPVPVASQPTAHYPLPTAERPVKKRGFLSGMFRTLFGCGCGMFVGLVLIITIIVVVAIQFGPNIAEIIKRETQRSSNWERLAEHWSPPPADAGPDRLFPPTVFDFQRTAQDAEAAVPVLDVHLPGRHATYVSSVGPIEVYAYRVEDSERAAVFARLNKAVQRASDKHFKFSNEPSSRRFLYSLGPPMERGALWGDKGWLFLARSSAVENVEEFLEAYLKAIAEAGANGKP